mgnify:CR=1 FL=1
MAQRVDDAHVKEILATQMDTQPFIVAASLLIDRYQGIASWSVALQYELERWLAAHLASMRDPRLRDMRDGDTAVQFERGKEGTGLDATSYGQQVKVLDYTGTLARALGARAVMFMVD